jgi:hypothetical protein
MAAGGGEVDDREVLFIFERQDIEGGRRMTAFIPRHMFRQAFRELNDTYPVRCVGFDAHQDDRVEAWVRAAETSEG